jgi:GTPase involved in cell partitioning and DNA repair
VADFRAVREELALFGGADLLEKPFLVAYNKIDLPDSGDYVEDVAELLLESCSVPLSVVLPVSAVTGEGVVTLVRFLPALPSLGLSSTARCSNPRSNVSMHSALDTFLQLAELIGILTSLSCCRCGASGRCSMPCQRYL